MDPFNPLRPAMSYPEAVAQYEELADKFFRETGYWAPGKDRPPELATPYSAEDLLWRLWEVWTDMQKARAFRYMVQRERDYVKTQLADVAETVRTQSAMIRQLTEAATITEQPPR
jgi:hypothetical protein